jgi:hypothetical protein
MASANSNKRARDRRRGPHDAFAARIRPRGESLHRGAKARARGGLQSIDRAP